MNLVDIINLAKAGYKKSDIDELLKIQLDEAESSSGSMDEEDPAEGAETELSEDHEEQPDYEKLYTDLRSEFDELKIKLEKVQQENVRKNNDDGSGTEGQLDLSEIVRAYM